MHQHQMPIVAALQAWVDKHHAPFYTPGHKRGQGINSLLKQQWGSAVHSWDLPELPGLDNLHAPTGAIAAAEILAAELFGATQTWFLVNGSTAGVMAAILATCGDGDKIILPRNVHSSALAGIIHAGAMPIWIAPTYDPVLDLAHSVAPEAVKFALEQHPDAKAVMLVNPNYYGICGDLAAIAAIVHSYGIPLLVDEAHGAHFGFHPDLPPAALAAGADLSIQSTHKTLGALTQSAMLHLSGDRIDPRRISQALRSLQSTSPSYLLLAALDAARQQMAVSGRELMQEAIDLATIARTEIVQIEGLSVLAFTEPTPSYKYLDPTRLTVTVTGLNLTGFAADDILSGEFGVVAELPSLQHLTFIISLGNTRADIERLIAGFRKLATNYRSDLPLTLPQFPVPDRQSIEMAITPRRASQSPQLTIPIELASGKISATAICPYPPGIPVLVPGEIITADALAYLRRTLDLGGELVGCSDPNLATIEIVDI